jgi:hypothetical protein
VKPHIYRYRGKWCARVPNFDALAGVMSYIGALNKRWPKYSRDFFADCYHVTP